LITQFSRTALKNNSAAEPMALFVAEASAADEAGMPKTGFPSPPLKTADILTGYPYDPPKCMVLDHPPLDSWGRW